MDCWADVTTPAGHLARGREILETFLPWEAGRARGTALADDNGVLTGRFAPTVRKPVGVLPSDRHVLGVADVVVLNDPITGQGSNNAAKCAATYLDAILARDGEPFDAAWMQQAFNQYWSYARHVTAWTNAMLAPPPSHVLELLTAAQQYPAIASRFVNGFDNPPDFAGWFMDPAKAARYLADASTAGSMS